MDSQALIRLAVFAGMFAVLTGLEFLIPDRDPVHPRRKRWPGNLMIIAIGNLATRLLGPLLPYAASVWVSGRLWGLSGLMWLPRPAAVIITVVILDAWVYLQHVLFHRVNFLRPFHRMHHSDTHIDFTTGFRMHPVEIILSAAYKSALIVLLGLDPLGVLIFELILNAAAMFSHANIRIPPALDRALQRIIITPDFHRIHHSRELEERNSNYGFFLSVWDRIFSTSTSTEAVDPRALSVGLPGYDNAEVNRIDLLLAEPFRPYPASRGKGSASGEEDRHG
jgi:sterol desaturase/sphingolipid hydroxylase (fatty acid hydroxylase superfamily)